MIPVPAVVLLCLLVPISLLLWHRKRFSGRESADREAVAKLEARFRAVVDSLGEGFVITDLEDRVLYVNNRMAELAGYQLEEMIGSLAHELLLREVDHPASLERLAQRRMGVSERYEWPLRRKDGSLFWTEIHSTPFRDQHGKIAGVLRAVSDISSRKRVEEALRASEQRYRLLFERNLAGVYRTTLEGELLDCNEACAHILGCRSRQEVLEHRVVDFYPNPAERQRFLTKLREHMSVTNFEASMRRPDGRTVYVLENATLIAEEGDGQDPVIEGTLFDVTERKELEDQLRQAQKMEAVGRLAGGVAHDFNNLLTIINGYSQLLLTELRTATTARRLVAEVIKAGERAAGLTRQLLAFSRHQAVEPEALDLNAVVMGLDTMLRRLIGEHIELVTVPGAGLGLIKADSSQMEQVILNLVVNAQDAMPAGGRLAVETSNARLDAAEARSYGLAGPGEYVVLTVRDNGCGMDAETQTHIFEPFFTTKDPGKGTGLGLATVYGIAKRSSGAVHVESYPGLGTTFQIYLPRLDAAFIRAEDLPEPVGAPLTGSETILVVEDDEMVRTLVRNILEAKGYHVTEASQGAEALEVYENRGASIDLVLTDVIMPQMSGRELSERLSQRHPDVKVVYMTGYTDTTLVQPAAAWQGSGFLMKPFKPDDLALVIRQALDRKTSLAADRGQTEHARELDIPGADGQASQVSALNCR